MLVEVVVSSDTSELNARGVLVIVSVIVGVVVMVSVIVSVIIGVSVVVPVIVLVILGVFVTVFVINSVEVMVKVGVAMHWCVISSIPFLQHSSSFDINSILQHSFPIAFSSNEQQICFEYCKLRKFTSDYWYWRVKKDFINLFGFDVDGIDYSEPTEI